MRSLFIGLTLLGSMTCFANERICTVTNWGNYEDSKMKILEVSFSEPAFNDVSAVESYITGKPQVVSFGTRILFAENALDSDATEYLEKMKDSGLCSNYVF